MFRQIGLSIGSFPFQIGIHNSHPALLSPSWCLFLVGCKELPSVPSQPPIWISKTHDGQFGDFSIMVLLSWSFMSLTGF
jgi:hypothetical protein